MQASSDRAGVLCDRKVILVDECKGGRKMTFNHARARVDPITAKEEPKLDTMAEDAVVVRRALKCYAKGQPNVLDELNLTVPKGCIYGLLGASGCGKTTLLSCVVGVCKLDSGDLWVLGGKPGGRNSGIPGPRVGYMPQEISLVKEMSIMGTLYYFGRINGLDEAVIDERFNFFSELLELPPKDRLIKHLSGGQQRRVSFAASFIHRPELLILDEPTVGLDSILREKIWSFLVKITKEQRVSVIITTHYIEEAKHANIIGLMRRGKLLAETTPQAILQKFQCPTLEEAFLVLSRMQKENHDKGITEVSNDLIDQLDEVSTHSVPSSHTDLRSSTDCIIKSEKQLLDSNHNETRRVRDSRSMASKVFKALMIKNLLQFLRHPGGVLFAFVFPFVQTTLFFYAIGRDPRGVVVAVVNEEAGNCNGGRYNGTISYDPDDRTCGYKDISCRFLHGFDESIMVKQFYETIEDARLAVQTGQASGAMHFMRNFSGAMQVRSESPDDATEEDFIAGVIHTALDMGDRQIGLWLQKKLFERFIQVHGDIVTQCNISRKFADMPIYFEEPIFGDSDQKYSDFVAPGFILTICFFLATACSSSIIIADRSEGVWDRSLVQGVRTSEILFSHMLTQMTMIVIQVVMVLTISFAYFNLSCEGSFSYVIAITMLVSISGMCYGFLISTLCTSQTLANFVATGSFYPLILLSGSIWPAEGMPAALRYFSFCLPATIPSITLRSVLEKSYTMNDSEVYYGFIVVCGWITLFTVCCLLNLRGKSV